MANGEELRPGPDGEAPAGRQSGPNERLHTLSEVDRRRTELWTTSLLVIAAVTVVVGLLAVGTDLLPQSFQLRSIASWIVLVLIVGLALAFLVYVVEKERSLRRLSDLLVEERVRSESLTSRVSEATELARLKNDFVATVSHELRTPLTTIIGAAKTMTRRPEPLPPERQQELIEMIQRQADKLLRLVEDFLTASRLESGIGRMQREPVDLRAVAEAVIADLSHTRVGAGREISLSSEPERPRVWGDATSVQQVLSNLIENALKYAGGDARVSVTVAETQNEATIEVSDNGCGIPQEKLDSLFERFRQVSGGQTGPGDGFGLGLFIVKNLVDAHRGEVAVKSKVGSGTTFAVRLPKRASDR